MQKQKQKDWASYEEIKKIENNNYIHLQDFMYLNHDYKNIGQLTILPSSYVEKPRYMHQQTQDAMAFIRKFGQADFFLTFTCNPKWPEISDELFQNQKLLDVHDIISRVFH